MSPDLLEKLRGAMNSAALPIEGERARLAETGLPHTHVMHHVKSHAERLESLDGLRNAMAIWGGRRRAEGRSDSEMQREFFLRFGVDVMTAQTLKKAEAQTLLDRIVKCA